MSFVTKEFIIPDSPPDSNDVESSGIFANKGRINGSNGILKGGGVLPAIPDSLTDALARAPPEKPTQHRRQSSKAATTTPTTPPRASEVNSLPLPLLPAIPAFSPLYDPSTIRSPIATPRQPATTFHSSPSPNLIESARNIFKSRSSVNLAGGTPSPHDSSTTVSLRGSPIQPDSAAQTHKTSPASTLTTKRSVWKSLSFGKKSSSDLASAASAPPIVLSASIDSIGLDESLPRPLLTRSSSSASTISRREGLASSMAAYQIPGDDESEVERLELQVEQAAARRANNAGRGGRGIDQDLDDMDFERDRGKSSRNNPSSEHELAVPWRGRTERYTFDLTEEGGYESEGDERLLKVASPDKRRSIDEPGSSGLLARRRNTSSMGITPIFAPSPTTKLESGPLSAPMLESPRRPLLAVQPIQFENSMASRSMSAGDVGLDGRNGLGETELAASLGIKVNTVPMDRSKHSNLNHRATSADFVVAVVGPRGVGKSVVIRKGLKKPLVKPTIVLEDDQDNRATASISQFTISGQSRSVEVLEVDMALLKYDSAGVIWPTQLPLLEGVIICYDATDPTALSSLSKLLNAFWSRDSNNPIIVLACKASTDDSQMAISTLKAAELCNIYGAGIVALESGIDDPSKKMKNSFNWIIRTIIDNRGDSKCFICPKYFVLITSTSDTGEFRDSERTSVDSVVSADSLDSPISLPPSTATGVERRAASNKVLAESLPIVADSVLSKTSDNET
jgi:GTPase SAR1 family protein